MLLGQHRYRFAYFFGRTLSFTLAGWMAAWIGEVMQGTFQSYGIATTFSFLLGLLISYLGLRILFKRGIPKERLLARLLAPMNQRLSLLLLKDQPFPIFLFGFLTVALPCGQTIIVFSACALALQPWIGAFNGFAFALLTSPSLFLAMQAKRLFSRFGKWEGQLMGIATLIVGVLAILRGLADGGMIDHLVLVESYHLVLY
jgi:sulfite exporter TauE/SafE